MYPKTTLSLIFAIAIASGFLLAQLNLTELPMSILLLLGIAALSGLIVLSRLKKQASPSYDYLSQELFKEIHHDIQAIHRLIFYVEKDHLRQQLDLICDDTVVLLNKVSEKSPESRISTGKFVRGNLDFILNDVLPQYIEMQETPRYYESPVQTMAEGHDAIEIYARFLHGQIAKLEIVDEIRYAVATEMLKALDAYVNNDKS